MIASIELSKALFSRLNSIAKTFGYKPTNPEFPFIEIGDEQEFNVSTKTITRTQHNITIHTFAKSKSSTSIKTINDAVKDQLLSLEGVQLNGFNVDLVKHTGLLNLTEPDADAPIWHSVFYFEFHLTEK